MNNYLKLNAIFAKNEPSKLMKNELDSWGINKSTLFYELYSKIALFPSGNGVLLRSLGEVERNHNLISIGDDEIGLLLYDILTDKVYFYEFDTEKSSDYYLEKIQPNFVKNWDTFKEFIEDYYTK